MSTTYIFNTKMNSRIDKVYFKERLVEILGGTDIRTAQAFTDEVYRRTKQLVGQENFIAGLIKGNAHKQVIDIDNFFKKLNIFINQQQKKEIHDLIQLMLASELNEYMTFQYITRTFPLMSFLKRELLETRAGTDIPQWQFIAEKCFVKKNITDDIKKYFERIANYKEIGDRQCAQVVSALVKSMTGKRFDTIISQKNKGWYPQGLEELAENVCNVSPYYLFLIAYSFKMTLEKYDEMLIRNGDIYDCFCYEENMFRFFIKYIRNINEICEFINIIDENRKYFMKPVESTCSAEYTVQRINDFFYRQHGTVEDLTPSFIRLLKKMGVVSAENREKILNMQRSQIASDNMRRLLKDTSLENITFYYSLLNNSVDDIIRFKYKDNPDQIERAIKVLQKNYEVLLEKTSDNEKAKILSMLCDRFAPKSSSYISASIRPILKSRFTTEHIGKISSCTTTDPITRSDILKIGYLRTFIDFVNKNNNRFRNKSEMIKEIRELSNLFEENTNKMLKDCCFAPVHITFPLDGLICIALSSGANDRCIPEVFQACLPIDTDRRTE